MWTVKAFWNFKATTIVQELPLLRTCSGSEVFAYVTLQSRRKPRERKGMHQSHTAKKWEVGVGPGVWLAPGDPGSAREVEFRRVKHTHATRPLYAVLPRVEEKVRRKGVAGNLGHDTEYPALGTLSRRAFYLRETAGTCWLNPWKTTHPGYLYKAASPNEGPASSLGSSQGAQGLW